jgi:hypothetical protein
MGKLGYWEKFGSTAKPHSRPGFQGESGENGTKDAVQSARLDLRMTTYWLSREGWGKFKAAR